MANDLNLQKTEKYTALLKDKVAEIYDRTPRAFIHTYGCQQNVSDSQTMQGLLEEAGYEICSTPEEADLVLYNTCAVREHAEDRVWGNIGVLKKIKASKENMIIAVCGCMMQQEKNAKRVEKSFPYVDILFGTCCRHRITEFIYRRLNGSKRIFELSMDGNDIVEGLPIKREDKFKAFVSVMYGCNNFCTYCIVPYVRGRERSREKEDILNEVRDLVAKGYKEITLLGQNVNSYGKTLEENIDFADLLKEVEAIPGDFRIRFMTSHPKDCTEKLLKVIGESDKICHHIHLPFQSGSSRILKLMNRHYDREKYLSLIEKAKEYIPDVTLSSDIIVGFPGETYTDFKETVTLIKEVEFSNLFTFIYSPRTGTPAAEMEDPVSREEKGKWFDELLKAQDEIGRKLTLTNVGKECTVLCEGKGRCKGMISGRSFRNEVIEFEGDDSMIGTFRKVKIESFEKGTLFGKLI